MSGNWRDRTRTSFICEKKPAHAGVRFGPL